jgi:ketosteroid isomerase-like protein
MDWSFSCSRALRIVTTIAIGVVASVSVATPSASAHEPDAEEVALGSLIDAELGFARMSLEQGIRAAFLANFAADGIVFEPAPVRLRETWSARPEGADAKSLRLDWQPAQAGVARSYDMGYTTGPFTLTDAAHPDRTRHGVFFSVWQRDAAGVWQVVLDIGITTPGPFDFVPLGSAPRPRYVGRADATAQRRAILARESPPIVVGQGRGTHYADLLAVDARLYRNDMAPVTGRDAVARQMASRAARIQWTPIEVRVAKSGDMAISRGTLRESGSDSGLHEGYYAHLWLRDRAGRWRIAYDIALDAK